MCDQIGVKTFPRYHDPLRLFSGMEYGSATCSGRGGPFPTATRHDTQQALCLAVCCVAGCVSCAMAMGDWEVSLVNNCY